MSLVGVLTGGDFEPDDDSFQLVVIFSLDGLMPSLTARFSRVLTGHASPAGEWLRQDSQEWVIVRRGSARLRCEGEDAPREMKAGDYIDNPARCRHRVEWTSTDEHTVGSPSTTGNDP